MNTTSEMNSTNEHARVILNPFLIYIALALGALLLQRFLPLPFIAQPWASILGVMVLIVSQFFGLPALRSMLTARTSPNPNRPTSTLIYSGPYRFTRNPMYIGLTLMFAGLSIVFRLSWGLVLLPVVVWLITAWVIVPEENYLAAKFGAAYADYKSRVHRWL
jgi:protein-S-isoprenylcysteine O-methyltransferase Ste14